MITLSDPENEDNGETESGKVDRTIRVITPKLDEVTKERDQLKEILSGIADEEIEKLRTQCKSLVPQSQWEELDNIEDPFELEAYLQGARKAKPSTGVVTFHSTRQIKGSPKFENPDEYAEWLYGEASNPESQFYEASNKALRLLWKKNPTRSMGSQKMEFADGLEAEAVRVLGKNFSYSEYTEWLRKRMRGIKKNE